MCKPPPNHQARLTLTDCGNCCGIMVAFLCSPGLFVFTCKKDSTPCLGVGWLCFAIATYRLRPFLHECCAVASEISCLLDGSRASMGVMRADIYVTTLLHAFPDSYAFVVSAGQALACTCDRAANSITGPQGEAVTQAPVYGRLVKVNVS